MSAEMQSKTGEGQGSMASESVGGDRGFPFGLGYYRWACGLWLSAMLYFTFATTPFLFMQLGAVEARRVLGRLFDAYHVANLAGVVLVVLGGVVILRSGARRAGWGLAVAILAWVLGPGLNQFFLRPWLQELREAGDAAFFGRVHGFSMSLNLLAMVLLLVATWLPGLGKAEVCASAGRPGQV